MNIRTIGRICSLRISMRLFPVNGLIFIAFALSQMSIDATAQSTAGSGALIPPSDESLLYYAAFDGVSTAKRNYAEPPSLNGSPAQVIPQHCWGRTGIGKAGTLSLLVFEYKRVLARHACPSADGKDATRIYPCSATLRAYMVLPAGYRFNSRKRSPVVALFHGGAWQDGSPMIFMPMAYHLASLGVPAVSFQYRISNVHDRLQMWGYDDYLSRAESTADAQSAIRWLRAFSTHFSFDPQNIITSGGSAGGHLALAPSLSDPALSDEDPKSIYSRVSSTANWMIPMYAVTIPTELGLGGSDESRASGSEAAPAPNISYKEASRIDPFLNIALARHTKGLLLLSGSADPHPLTPLWSHRKFLAAYNRVTNNRGQLKVMEGGDHGFNSVADSMRGGDGYETAYATIDNFLIEKGLMQNWTGQRSATERIRWLRRAMDPINETGKFGYDRLRCGAMDTPIQQAMFAFHGYNFPAPDSAPMPLVVGNRTFMVWNKNMGGLW